jgi:surface carbohydrate biosynthesis protein
MVVIQLGSFMDILIPIETASRELLYKVYLCRLLALERFTCYLGRKSEINYLLGKFTNYIYLDKGYHEGLSERIYATVKNNRGIIISLDEEGAVDYVNGSTLRNRYSEKFFNSVDFTFLWGSKPYEIIKDNISCKNKTKITGHPRFELLKPEFHYLYKKDRAKLKKIYGDFILINTNMGFGNNIKGDEFVVDNYGKRFENIKDIIEFDKYKVREYCLLAVELSKLSNKTIIFRPHPEEDQSYYTAAFDAFENIKVIYEGSVVPWLLASEQVIHPDCTTAVEAFFIGKTPISFLPENSPDTMLTEAPLKVSVKFNKIDHLISYLNNFKKNKIDESVNRIMYAEEYFSYSKSSINGVIEQFVTIKRNTHNSQNNRIGLGVLLYLKLKHLYNKVRSNSMTIKLGNNKMKGFDDKNIKLIFESIPNIDDKTKVKVNRISEKLFTFSIE